MGFCFQFFWQHIRRSNVIMIHLVTFTIKKKEFYGWLMKTNSMNGSGPNYFSILHSQNSTFLFGRPTSDILLLLSYSNWTFVWIKMYWLKNIIEIKQKYVIQAKLCEAHEFGYLNAVASIFWGSFNKFKSNALKKFFR